MSRIWIVYWSGIEKDKKTFLLVWDYRVECTPSHIQFTFLLSTFLCYLPFIRVDFLFWFLLVFVSRIFIILSEIFYFCCVFARSHVYLLKFGNYRMRDLCSSTVCRTDWLLSIIYNIWYSRWKFGRIFQVILFFAFYILYLFSCYCDNRNENLKDYWSKKVYPKYSR